MIDAIVISAVPLAPDVRVRRTVGVLVGAGLRVATLTPVSRGNKRPADPWATAVRHVTVPFEAWTQPRRVRTAAAFLAAYGLSGEAAALGLARAMPNVAALEDRLMRLIDSLDPKARPLIVANDWTTLPAAIRAHDRYGCRIHYDTHELAVAEHASSHLWRFIFPHLIGRIERAGLRRAALVSCVSQGIAAEMARDYDLAEPPLVVRNLPDQLPLLPTPVSDPVRVLYHGLFKPDRGLLAMVESAGHWPDGFQLLLRGRANNPAFGAELAAAALAPAVSDRVRLEPMVPPEQVVEAANAADIGVFLPDLAFLQNRYALPNKLFEYLSAGLMVIVPAGTDMGDLIATIGAGLVLDDASPQGLAAAIRSLTPERIAANKLAAHDAARQLDFATEAALLRQCLGLG